MTFIRSFGHITAKTLIGITNDLLCITTQKKNADVF